MPMMFYYGRNGHRYSCEFSKENVKKHAEIMLQFCSICIGNGTVITITPGSNVQVVRVFNRQRQGFRAPVKHGLDGYRAVIKDGTFDTVTLGWSC